MGRNWEPGRERRKQRNRVLGAGASGSARARFRGRGAHPQGLRALPRRRGGREVPLRFFCPPNPLFFPPFPSSLPFGWTLRLWERWLLQALSWLLFVRFLRLQVKRYKGKEKLEEKKKKEKKEQKRQPGTPKGQGSPNCGERERGASPARLLGKFGEFADGGIRGTGGGSRSFTNSV